MPKWLDSVIMITGLCAFTALMGGAYTAANDLWFFAWMGAALACLWPALYMAILVMRGRWQSQVGVQASQDDH